MSLPNLIAVILLALLATPVLALGNRYQLTDTGTFTRVEQTGPTLETIRRNLSSIKLPPGFHISLYARVPDARHMAVSADGSVVFVGTRQSEFWVATDGNGDDVADQVQNFAPGLAKNMPNGPCLSPEGDLFIAEQNRVLAFPDAASTYRQRQVPYRPVVADGELIPRRFTSRGHSARVCDIGPDGKLYISLGQPYNVPPASKLAAFRQYGIGGIIRINQDGSDREVYTLGIRNSVGQQFHPATGHLWFTDNQVDGMGDEIPPGEINRQTRTGQHFGFPWYGGGHTRTNEYRDDTPPSDVVFPVSETTAHAADLGMTFYTGSQFPAEYRGGLFSAQHGSWNRTTPVGARVMFTPVDAHGSVTGPTRPFAEGWLSDGRYLGRPVDVAQLPDGSLLISDDRAGAVYRIVYRAP